MRPNGIDPHIHVYCLCMELLVGKIIVHLAKSYLQGGYCGDYLLALQKLERLKWKACLGTIVSPAVGIGSVKLSPVEKNGDVYGIDGLYGR